MIIHLEGEIKLKTDKFIVLDVNGVGYRVFSPAPCLKKIITGEKASLWTHLHIRENAMELYGFSLYPELEFFEQLIQISGIGPKSALAILSIAPIDELKKAIASSRLEYLTKVSGIGRRLAEKIVVELKDKLSGQGVALSDASFKEEEEAMEALRSLGYSLRESRDAIRRLPEGVSGTKNIIKEALKKIDKF